MVVAVGDVAVVLVVVVVEEEEKDRANGKDDETKIGGGREQWRER